MPSEKPTFFTFLEHLPRIGRDYTVVQKKEKDYTTTFVLRNEDSLRRLSSVKKMRNLNYFEHSS